MLALLAALAAGAVLNEADARAAPQIEAWPDEPRSVEIVYHDRRILAPVHIEGVGERLFIIDTAAGTSLVTAELFDRLTPAPGHVRRQRVRGATGVIELDYVRLPGLDFGGLRHKGVWAVVADGAAFAPAGGFEVAGILGVDVLAQSDLRLDLANGRLELSPYSGPGRHDGIAFHSAAQAGFVQFTAEINGAPVAAVLDTGAPSGTLNWAAARLAGLGPHSSGVVRTGGRSAGVDGVGVDRVEARVDGLCVGRACFNGAPVRIADLDVFGLVGADGGAGPSMLVGADLLELCPAEILYSQGVLRLCEG